MPRMEKLGHAPGFEYPETDADWHGRVLDEIEEHQAGIWNSLQNLETELKQIGSHMEEVVGYLKASHYSKMEQKQSPVTVPPLSNKRFIFNWVVVIILFAVYTSHK